MRMMFVRSYTIGTVTHTKLVGQDCRRLRIRSACGDDGRSKTRQGISPSGHTSNGEATHVRPRDGHVAKVSGSTIVTRHPILIITRRQYNTAVMDQDLLGACKVWLEPLDAKSLPALNIQTAFFEHFEKVGSIHLTQFASSQSPFHR
jgi:hypothetical protein